jgi:hypothetical protein
MKSRGIKIFCKINEEGQMEKLTALYQKPLTCMIFKRSGVQLPSALPERFSGVSL